MDTATLVAIATDLYLADGRDHTVKEIALAAGITEARTRKLLTDPAGFAANGLTWDWSYQTTYSRDYPMFSHGATRKHLASLLASAKA